MGRASDAFLARIRTALEPRGAVAEFCRKTGFARGSVLNWLEKGQSPNVENLDRIAEFLKVEPWELIKDPDDAPKAPKEHSIEDCLRAVAEYSTSQRETVKKVRQKANRAHPDKDKG